MRKFSIALAATLLATTVSAEASDLPTDPTAPTPYVATDYLALSHGGAWNKVVAEILNPCSAAPAAAGIVPTPPNDATKFLNGQCAWAVPAGVAANPAGVNGDFQINSAGVFGAFTPGTGIQTFLTTPSSANLRAALTDETGTGAAYFVGGALGTPSSGTATNLSGTAAGLTAGNVTTNANLTGPVTSTGNATAITNAAVTYAKVQNGASSGLLAVHNGSAPTEAVVGTGLAFDGTTLTATGGGAATGVGVQTGQSPSNIGDNATALPSGHYYYATNVVMTAQRTHNLPDSATQGVGDIEIFDAQQTATATNQLCAQAAGTDKINTVTNGTACITTAGGSIYLHNDAAGNYTTGAAANIPAPTNGQIIVGKTGSPANSLAAVTPSQDCTMTNAGVFTCLKTSNVSFGALATTVPGTNVATAAAANLSAVGGFPKIVAQNAKALGTPTILSATCATVVTDTATGTLTTDVVLASFNGDPTGVTGYIPATAGMLTIIAYPTADTVNFKVCNNTSGSITPGAITLNWKVLR